MHRIESTICASKLFAWSSFSTCFKLQVVNQHIVRWLSWYAAEKLVISQLWSCAQVRILEFLFLWGWLLEDPSTQTELICCMKAIVASLGSLVLEHAFLKENASRSEKILDRENLRLMNSSSWIGFRQSVLCSVNLRYRSYRFNLITSRLVDDMERRELLEFTSRTQ